MLPALLVLVIYAGFAAARTRTQRVPALLALGAMGLVIVQLAVWFVFWRVIAVAELHLDPWLPRVAVFGRLLLQTTAVGLLVAAAVWPREPR